MITSPAPARAVVASPPRKRRANLSGRRDASSLIADINGETILAADLFCGAGGATTALVMAAKQMGVNVDLVAVNHWDIAVETHSRNYPSFVHYCQMVGKVAPRQAVPGGYLTILLAGPECINHSNAKGGKPRDNQSRCSAFDIIWWLTDLDVRNVLIENVREWRDWGPLYTEENAPSPDLVNKPIPSRKGEYFKLFLDTLRSLGYQVEYKMLCAADYGDPTTRKRLFLFAWKGGSAPEWPTPTHRPVKDMKRFPGAKPWVAARSIINWEIRGESIFGRKKSLAPNTVKRIEAGLLKYCGLPFVIGQQSCAAPRSTDEPIPTIATAGMIRLAQPYLVVLKDTKERQVQESGRSLDLPLPTVHGTGSRGHFGLCQPFVMVNRTHREGHVHSVHGIDEPLRTLTTGENMAVIEPTLQPFLVGGFGEREKQAPRVRSVEEPLNAVTATGWTGIVEPKLQPFLMNITHSHATTDRVAPVDEPLQTQTGHAEFAVVEPALRPFLVGVGGPKGKQAAQNIEQPLPTVMGQNHVGVVEPVLTAPTFEQWIEKTGAYSGSREEEEYEKIYPEGDGGRIDPDPYIVRFNGPVSTLDGSNRFGLAQPYLVSYYGNGDAPVVVDSLTDDLEEGDQVYVLDILFRMLTPEELAAAHSFPETYSFAGVKGDRVRQVGNSWPVRMGAALCQSLLSRPGGRERSKAFKPAPRVFRLNLQQAIALMNASEKQMWPTLWEAAGEELVLGGKTR